MIHIAVLGYEEAHINVAAFTDEAACLAAVNQANDLCNEVYATEDASDAVKVWEKIYDVLPPLRKQEGEYPRKSFADSMVKHIHFHRNHERRFGGNNPAIKRPHLNFGLFHPETIETIG